MSTVVWTTEPCVTSAHERKTNFVSWKIRSVGSCGLSSTSDPLIDSGNRSRSICCGERVARRVLADGDAPASREAARME